MKTDNKISIFENTPIRKIWDSEIDDWHYSVVDICGALDITAQDPRKYWNDLKDKLKQEGSQLSEKIRQLKMRSQKDGKMYSTDTLDTAGVLRLIQSIPSKKAEPFKVWLAEVGYERLEEIADPEKAIIRGADYYRKKGYTEEWINRRMHGIDIRKKLTAEWEQRGITDRKEYAILTSEMTKVWSGMRIVNYKEHKGISPKENLRDNMTDIEIALTDIAEITTTDISRKEKPETFGDNIKIAQRGGSVAKATRDAYERELGVKVVSQLNARNKELLEVKKRTRNIEE
jgi:hypothetical protein